MVDAEAHDADREVVVAARDLVGCEHRLALDHTPGLTPPVTQDSPEVTQRKQAAADHRARIRRFLAGVHSDGPPGTFAVVAADDHRTRVAQTLAACARGADWIYNADLPTDHDHGRKAHSELLVRADSGYLPVIVVNHRVSQPVSAAKKAVRPDGGTMMSSPMWGWMPMRDPNRSVRNQRRDLMRLAQLSAMLGDLGLGPQSDSDRVGGVIGLDADCIVVHSLSELIGDYRQTFDRRKSIARQEIHTEPRRINECRSCPWWTRCGPELTERRDVSLVVTGNQATVLTGMGISTIDELARYPGPAPADRAGRAPFDDVIVCAAAWLDGTKLIRRVDEPSVTRADVEVDVDMESYGEDGAYLWGTLLTDTSDPTREVRYRPFVTWDPLPTLDESRSFAEFWQWLTAERDAARADGKTFAAYCYSQSAENRWLLSSADRFIGRPGIPTRREVEDFIGSDEWVDIFEAVGRNFICPDGKGLKRIAPVAGFAWRDAEPSGEASMGWYREAVGMGDSDVDPTQRTRLLEYNEDDVRATKVLREWITDSAKDALPHEDQYLAFRRAEPGAPAPESEPERAQSVEERPATQQGDGPEK